MKKRILIAVLVCAFAIAGSSADAKKNRVVKAIGGTPIPGLSLIIDASYDPKLDTFAPGYKMLNVAIMNNSFDIIEMDPKKDEWWIKTKDKRKKYRVIGNLRGEDPVAWNLLPDRARNMITYPLLLPIGARQVIDLFVPENVPVEEFQELVVRINSLGTTFEITARQ